MLTMSEEDADVVVVTASGKLHKEDYDRFVPTFERIVRERGSVRVLIELQDFHGWDLPGLWEELKFDIAHLSDMGRVAIVGDKAWQEWGTRLSTPFVEAEMRYFDHGRTAEAREWLTAAA